MVTGSKRVGNSLSGAAVFLLLCASANAQQPTARITGEIRSQERTALRGSHPPLARAENEAGRVPAGTRLQGVSIVFSRTETQEAELQSLIASQQDPASPLYQQWLTPEEFGVRFGMADVDIATVTNWLEQQGFTVESVSRSKNQITFSGTVQHAEQAFGAELHYYSANGERHFAPYADLMLPTALASVVQAVTNLSTFRPRSHVVRKGPQPGTQYHYTSSQSGNYFLTPKDIATIYDITPAYNAGLNGTGQAIAVVGQSPIVMTDIEHFQTASGVFTTPKDPTLNLVPKTGSGTTPVTGDEAESDLDLEYSSTIAPGATIHFVYTGGNANTSVWDSLQYAITSNLAPIISISYGLCEPMLGQSSYNSLNAILAQAATQGQTVISASGDGGSADCAGMSGASTAEQQQLSVDFPSSSQYVTGIGGTEFPSADVDPTNAASAPYWQPKSSSDIVSSALKYIPEQVWNDTTSGNISSGGGGLSTLTARPSWQSGVPGISSGAFRLVPDISLSASPNNAGYLYCSSDTSTNVTGSCTAGNGFRDSSNSLLTVAGGTSFGAPIFAGMMAIINQKTGKAQGVANTKLYSLATNSATYASAFHDTTSGNNNCSLAGTTVCPTTISPYANYSAGSGYDLATGLGSIDFANLLTAWSGSIAGRGFTLSANNVTVTAGGTGTSTVAITPQNGYTGTIAWTISSSPASSSLCFSMGSATVSGTSAVTASLTIKTSSTACGTAANIDARRGTRFAGLPAPAVSSNSPSSLLGFSQAGLALAALVLIGWGGRRSRELRVAGCPLFLIAAGLLTGCSGSSTYSPPPSGTAAKGTYTVTITATDTATSSVTASTSMTLTID